ncbi:hypothetical protein BAUCODRAFT_44540, partial [Baudoinia panamericana UAMH 10762]
PTPSRLLTIPPEIREHIYRLILHPHANRQYHEDEYTSYDYRSALVLFRINRQIYLESRKIFRDLNVFVRIETPWPEAQQHVALEGHVPIFASGKRVSKFTGHSLNVAIDAPDVFIPSATDEEQCFLILLDDLDKFTQMWFYSNLSHPGLNPQLRLTLKLRDPYTPDWDEKRVSKSLQRGLLLPFGKVRNLHSVVISGDPKPLPSIETELRALQALPVPSPEHCLREATRLKQEGNVELTAGRYTAALELYKEAWKAMHVIVAGRQRHIHADRFFAGELQEEPYKGKIGQQERLVLRVQLVANTCQAYLKQEKYDDCAYWGKRSISMLRQAMG